MLSNNKALIPVVVVVVILVGDGIILINAGLAAQLNVGIVLPSEQKNGFIDQGYRWGLKYLNKWKGGNNTRILPKNTELLAHSIYVKNGDSFRASKELCKLLGSGGGVVAILGGASNYDPSLEWKLFWTSARLDVPLFFVSPSFARHHGGGASPSTGGRNKVEAEFSLRLAPTLAVWGALLREFTKYLGLENVAILYEDERGLMRTQALLKEPSPVEHIIVRKVGKDSSYWGVLSEAKNREIRHLIIDCGLNSLTRLLDAIEGLHMTDYKYHYILTNLDLRTTDMTSFIRSHVNLTAFQVINPDAKNVQDKLFELRQLDKEINATLGNNKTGIIHTETALAFDSVMALGMGLSAVDTSHELKPENLSCESDSPWKDGSSLLNYITATEFKGLSGIVSFREGERSNQKLDIIRLGANGWRKVGFWTPERRLNITKPKAFWDHGLTNATLLVTCVLEAPYVQLRQGSSNLTGNSRYEGFSVDLLKLIANFVGFNYVLEVVPDGKYGVYDSESGEWNGVVSQLIDKSVDLAIGALTITHARESVIDFTKPFMHFGISILYRKPIRTQTGIFTFLKPLALEIWLSVAVSYLLVGLTMFVVAKFSPYECWPTATSTAMSYGVGMGFTISNALWYPIGTLMQQGSDQPSTTPTRIVGGIWWFFSIVIVSSYTANLAAFLTVQRLANPIESARDLVEQSDVTYGSLESGTTMAYFRDSKIETYQKMWRFMESRKPPVFTETYAEGVRRVLQGKYAFLMESTTIAYVMAQNCNLTQVGSLLNSKGYALALPKGSPWKDKISLAILELQELGVIRWYQDKWWSTRSSPSPDDIYCNTEYKKDTTASALGVDSIGGIFVVLLIGLGIAAIVALLEFCWNTKKQSTSDQVTLCTEMREEAKFVCLCSGPKQRPELVRHCDSCESRQRSREATPLPQIPTPPPPPVLSNYYPRGDQEFFEFEDDYSFSPAYEEQQEMFGIRNRGGGGVGGDRLS